MSTPVQNSIKLPNDTAIQKYVMDHSLFTAAVSTGLLVTNLLPTVVKYLAGKEISSDQVQKNVQIAMDAAVQTSSAEDQKKLCMGVVKKGGTLKTDLKTLNVCIYVQIINNLVQDMSTPTSPIRRLVEKF